MAAEPRMRRRPSSAGKPERRHSSSSSPGANVMDDRGAEDAKAVMSAVLNELAVRADAFVRELGLREMKPWGEFFARFKAPRAWNLSVLDERLTTNFLYYRGNYSIVAAAFVLIGIVTNVTVLLALVLSTLLLTFLFPDGGNRRVVRIGSRVLENSERMTAAILGIALIFALSGAWYNLLCFGGAGASLCLVHAVFRPRTMRSKATRLSDDVRASGGFTIEGAQNFVERTFGMKGSSN